jgi:protein-disulfide isomerase
MERDIVYGGSIVVLVALLMVSMLTQGFGVVPCPATPTNSSGNGSTGGMVPGVSQLSVGVGDMPALGQTSAPVTWIEISDYQCIFCAKLSNDASKNVKSNYVNSGKVKMYFRDYPLGFHANADDAALAARCANDGGKFWEMHDKLFATQSTWSSATNFQTIAEGYATDLGLDKSTFSSCMSSNKYSSQISSDMSDASSVGVEGTPAVFMLLPKDKTDYTKLKSALGSGYGSYMDIYQDEDNYIVMVVGALPYSAFQSVLDTVTYS